MVPEPVCLIVDDERAIRTFLRSLLELEGFRCVEADCASKAMIVLESQRGQIGLLITDVKMPGEMDGLELAHKVQQLFPAIPVILISGYVDENRTGKPRDFRWQFIQKPFVAETLLVAVRRALRPAGSS